MVRLVCFHLKAFSPLFVKMKKRHILILSFTSKLCTEVNPTFFLKGKNSIRTIDF